MSRNARITRVVSSRRLRGAYSSSTTFAASKSWAHVSAIGASTFVYNRGDARNVVVESGRGRYQWVPIHGNKVYPLACCGASSVFSSVQGSCDKIRVSPKAAAQQFCTVTGSLHGVTKALGLFTSISRRSFIPMDSIFRRILFR